MAAQKIFIDIYRRLYEKLGPQHWWPADTAFEVMVGAILTQNTNWQNVESAIHNIKSAGLLSPRPLLKNARRIPGLVRPAGYYNVKSRRLVAFLKYLVEKYEGNVSDFKRRSTGDIRNELLSIPGIGRETADSMLLYALRRPVFVIDAYTRRIFARHGVFDADLDYDEIREMFEKNLPAEEKTYNEYHALIVRTGKTYCRKNEPRCTDCPLRSISRRSR
jgi:endonuclease-3 related protein